MKRTTKSIFALIMVLIMCVSFCVPTFAEVAAAADAKTARCPGADAEHTMTNCTNEKVKTVAPQCGSFGYDLYECTTCRKPIATNWTEVGDGTDKWGEWQVVTQPTCTDYGVMKRVCLNDKCGNEEIINVANYAEKTAAYGVAVTDAIKPLDHDITANIPTDLECKDGIPEHTETCSRCDYTNKVPATPGQDCDRYVVEILEAPNCYETGLAEVACKNPKCKYYTNHFTDVIVNATGSKAHTWDATKTVVSTKPTCGTAGSGTLYCYICQQTVNVVENKVTITYTTATGATSTDEITLDASYGFAATGVHDFSDEVKAEAPDCVNNGTKAHFGCKNCDAISLDGKTPCAKKDVVDPAKGHNWEDTAYKAPSCNTAGNKAYSTCTVCAVITLDKTAKEVVLVDLAATVLAPAHSYDLEGKPVAESTPTCTRFGFKFYGCTVCGMPATANGEENIELPADEEGWISAGVYRIPMLPHDCTESVKVPGDCTTAEVVARDCKDCNFYEEVSGNIPGHSWKTVTYLQNCKYDGYSFDYCTVCGLNSGADESDGIVIDECKVVRIATTAEAAGKLPVTDAIGRYNVIPADPENHKWDEVQSKVTTPATCTGWGKAVKFCVLCSDFYNVDIQPLGHNNHEFVKEFDPKCGVDGYYVYSCDRCDDTTVEYQIKAHEMAKDHPDYATKYDKTKHKALVHTFVTKKDVYKKDLPTNYKFVHDEKDSRYVAPAVEAAKCTTIGYDTYTCVNPGCTETHSFTKKADGSYIYPALAHKEAGKDAYKHIVELPYCKPEDTDGDGEIELVGVAGREYDKCDLCDHVKNETAIEFDWNVAKHHRDPADATIVPTIYADTKWHNGVEYADAAAADAAAGGVANGIMRVGACDVSQLVEYYCSVCGYTFHAEDASMVGSHAPKAGTEVGYNAPTCTDKGNYAHYECEKCGKNVWDQDKDGKYVVYNDATVLVIPANGHKWTETKAKAPNCTEAGAQAYYTCSVCKLHTLDKDAETVETFAKAELADKIYIKANGHDWGNSIKEVPATCANPGTKAYYDCKNCTAVSLDGKTTCKETDLVIPAINHVGHMVDSVKVEAKCLTPGYQYHYCNLCNYEYVDNYVYAHGHTFGKQVEKVEAKCGTTGFEAHYLCTSECGGMYLTNDRFDADVKTVADLTIAATGVHKNANGGTIVATCTDVADDRFCVGCNTTIPATHPEKQYGKNDVEATCTEFGYTVERCLACNYEKVTKKLEFAPTNPDHADDTKLVWVITTPATQYTDGLQTLTCPDCGFEKDTETIPALGGIVFSYEIDNAIYSGAEYVNGGKIKLTINYKAVNVDLASISLRLNYNAGVLTFDNGAFLCGATDAEGNKIFNTNNAYIGGNTAGFVTINAKTFGFGEAPANKKLNGEGVLAEIYFNINKDVAANSTIAFEVDTTTALANSQVLKADGSSASYVDFGTVKSETTKALADLVIDGKYNSADDIELLNIAFAQKYVAAADINQNGFIDLDDYGYLLDLILGDITYEEMCKKAQETETPAA